MYNDLKFLIRLNGVLISMIAVSELGATGVIAAVLCLVLSFVVG